jgi:hypothetical protein
VGGYSGRVLDFVLALLTVLVFAALLFLGAERRGTRAVVIPLALMALGLSIWRAVRDGKWWMAVAGTVVAVVWIGLAERKARRSPAARQRSSG